MGSYHIEIPQPVFTVDTVYDPAAIGTGEIVAQVSAGGVVVFEKAYTNEWSTSGRPDNFAHNDEDARGRVSAAFGEKIKKLLEG